MRQCIGDFFSWKTGLKYQYFKILFVCLLGTHHPSASFAEIDKGVFKSDFEKFVDHSNEPLPESVIKAHENTIFIFVTGLAGNKMPDVFSEAASVLGGEGPRALFVRPPDNQSLAQNTEFVRQSWTNIVQNADPKSNFIIMGSSAGSVEAWSALKLNPELFGDRLLGAIFLQGPFGGTPFADLVVQDNPLEALPPPTRPLEGVARKAAIRRFSSPKVRPKMQSMTTTVATEHTLQVLEQAPTSEFLPDEKLLYFTSTRDPLPFLQRFWPGINQKMHVCGRIVSRLSEGPNDGLVPLPLQIPPGGEPRSVYFPGINHLEMIESKLGRALAKAALTSTVPK